MKKIIILLSLFLIIIFSGCNRKENTESSRMLNSDSTKISLDSVLVTYDPGWVDTFVAVKCERLAYIQSQHPTYSPEEYRMRHIDFVDTFIVEKAILNKIQILAEKRDSVELFDENARMYVTLKYTNGITDNICLGMEAPIVKFNGEPVIIENELVYLLRAYTGYYDWFHERYPVSFVELQDTTFEKRH